MRVLRYNYYLSWIASQLDTACKFFTLYTFATVGTKISFLDELEQNKCFDDKTGLLDIASLPNTLKGIEVDMAFSFALRAFATIHSLLTSSSSPVFSVLSAPSSSSFNYSLRDVERQEKRINIFNIYLNSPNK